MLNGQIFLSNYDQRLASLTPFYMYPPTVRDHKLKYDELDK